MKINKDLFISNIYDPSRPDAEDRWVKAEIQGDAREVALEAVRDFLAGKVFGPPRPTPLKTVDQLTELGYVGVYNKVDPKIFEVDHTPTIDDQPVEPPVSD
jgi:hypothetical protein